jgi:hypothetical protein
MTKNANIYPCSFMQSKMAFATIYLEVIETFYTSVAIISPSASFDECDKVA